MLTIRSEQMKALAVVCLPPLRDALHQALCQHWPSLAEELGEESVEYILDQAMERCAFYGIEMRRDYFRYLNVMALLGADFDEDFPWARQLLEMRNLRGTTRMDRLVETIRLKVGGGDL